jgi:hypothetical protein
MTENSVSAQEALLNVYIGQHINSAGILQSETNCGEHVKTLVSDGLVRENQWYRFHQFMTTNKGSTVAASLVRKRTEEEENRLRAEFKGIPSRVLGFLVNRFVPKKLYFRTEKPYFLEAWEDRILTDERIWILWKKFFASLESVGLSLRTHDYVSTRGGELRDLYYVISPEIQEYLIKRYSLSDFTLSQEETLIPYPVLTSTFKILSSDNIDVVRQRYFELLRSHSVTEGQIAGIVNRMNQQGIASEYRGLLAEKKPFEVIDPTRFQIYLDRNLIEPAIEVLLEKGGQIKQFSVDARIPSLSEVKIERGFLDTSELGDFYIVVSAIERDLREFIKAKLGKGWHKRIEIDVPEVFRRWQDKKKKDESWGIDPEQDFMNYADLEDYIEIIRTFDRMFVDGDRHLSNVITYLEIWYKYGRNPLMHSRTVTRQKFETTKSAIDFLKKWMAEKS